MCHAAAMPALHDQSWPSRRARRGRLDQDALTHRDMAHGAMAASRRTTSSALVEVTCSRCPTVAARTVIIHRMRAAVRVFVERDRGTRFIRKTTRSTHCNRQRQKRVSDRLGWTLRSEEHTSELQSPKE